MAVKERGTESTKDAHISSRALRKRKVIPLPYFRAEDPRSFGKPLRHSKFGLQRYRLRDYRIICQLQRSKLIVLVVAIGHRSTVYDD